MDKGAEGKGKRRRGKGDMKNNARKPHPLFVPILFALIFLPFSSNFPVF